MALTIADRFWLHLEMAVSSESLFPLKPDTTEVASGFNRPSTTYQHYQISFSATCTTRPGPEPVMRPNVPDERLVTGLLKFT